MYLDRCLLLKLDKQPFSGGSLHPKMHVYCSTPPTTWHPPPQVLCLLCCKNRPVDGATNLLV